MVGKTDLFNIKSRHLVDIFHTYEINTQKPFEMSQYEVHCLSGIFCLIFHTESWSFEVFSMERETLLSKSTCFHVLVVSQNLIIL